MVAWVWRQAGHGLKLVWWISQSSSSRATPERSAPSHIAGEEAALALEDSGRAPEKPAAASEAAVIPAQAACAVCSCLDITGSSRTCQSPAA